MRRRDLLSCVGASMGAIVAAALLGCESAAPRSDPRPPGARSDQGQGKTTPWREVAFAPDKEWAESGRVAYRVAEGKPLLLALHGAGEHARGLVPGALGWRDDYALDRGEGRLRAPPLTSADFESYVTPQRLVELNDSLAKQPFEGLSVACPFTPRAQTLEAAKRWASWLERTLLPRLRDEAGLPANVKLGIDGVSMGGRLALLLGLGRPDLFDSVGALQPALAVEEVSVFVELAVLSQRARSAPLRLVTSEGDPFREAIQALADGLLHRSVEHRLLVTPGPHDYAWNRGPGSLEMLLWHDRVLRGRSSV